MFVMGFPPLHPVRTTVSFHLLELLFPRQGMTHKHVLPILKFCYTPGIVLQVAMHEAALLLLLSDSVVSDSATRWSGACPDSLSFTIAKSLFRLLPIALVMPSNHLILCHLLSLPSIFPSIRADSSESAFCIKWPKYWSFSISPSNEYSGLISFRNDWLNLRAVQGALKNLLQHHNSKVSVLQDSAFFMV